MMLVLPLYTFYAYLLFVKMKPK